MLRLPKISGSSIVYLINERSEILSNTNTKVERVKLRVNGEKERAQ